MKFGEVLQNQITDYVFSLKMYQIEIKAVQ